MAHAVAAAAVAKGENCHIETLIENRVQFSGELTYLLVIMRGMSESYRTPQDARKYHRTHRRPTQKACIFATLLDDRR